jgi:hypothetical protein
VLRKIKEERRRKKEERTNGRDKNEGGGGEFKGWPGTRGAQRKFV